MKHRREKREAPDARVVLAGLPPGLIDGLPAEDQKAISAIVGKPVQLVGYDADGRAELKFIDAHGVIHFMYVQPSFIRSIE